MNLCLYKIRRILCRLSTFWCTLIEILMQFISKIVIEIEIIRSYLIFNNNSQRNILQIILSGRVTQSVSLD